MREPTDILFLNQAAVLGGGELSLRDVATHFRDRSRVALLTDGPLAADLRSRGVAVDIIQAPGSVTGARREGGLGSALWSGVGVARLVTRLLPAARGARLLYANSQKAFVLAALLGMAARRPVIWHLRDVLSADHFSHTARRTGIQLARACGARVIANSQATADSFVASGGRPDRVTTIHNGISPEPYDGVDPSAVAAARAELGLKPNHFVVGAFSRLTPWKGQHVLVEAIARCSDVQAICVGEALFGETDYHARLLRQIEQRGVGDRVHMLGFRSDIPALMKACDAVAHTSIAPEPFGRVIVEAMLAGRPVIATAAGGAKEVLTDESQGVLVSPDDAAALAEAIDRLQADPAHAAELAEAGRRRAVEAFSLGRMLARIEAEVDRLIDPQSSTQSLDRAAPLPAASAPNHLDADPGR